MDAINFDSLFTTLLNNITALAKEQLKDYVSQAVTDGENMLQQLKQQLQQWTQELQTGELTGNDFAFLLQGEKEEVEMVALKQEGLAAVRIDMFKAALVNMIFTTIGNTIKV
jgi:hypothetical protein